jgi:hypothetical protein
MNWRDSKEVNTYHSQPPCEGDSAIVSTTDDGNSFAVPDHIAKDEPLFLSTFNVPTYLQRLSLEVPGSDERGAVSEYTDANCIAGGGSIVAGTISVSLGSCDPAGTTTTFFETTQQQAADECVSSCPPLGLLEDGASLETIMDPSTGEEKLILITYNAQNEGKADDDATITSEVGADGHTYYTITGGDGSVSEHVMESTDPGVIKKRTTTTTTRAADDVFTLKPSVDDLSDLKSKEIKELLKAIEQQVEDCEAIYGSLSGDVEDKCASQRDLVDMVNAQYSSAKAAEDKEANGGSTTVIIVAAVAVFILVVVVAVYLVVRMRNNSEDELPKVSFENPLSVVRHPPRTARWCSHTSYGLTQCAAMLRSYLFRRPPRGLDL